MKRWAVMGLLVMVALMGLYACSDDGDDSTTDGDMDTELSEIEGDGAVDGDGDDLNLMQRYSGPDWYKHVVFYEIWVRSFNDTNGDGIGDLRGVTEKLDYLADLGVGALWLTPYYPTPYFDSGYDVADYLAINPEYGTMEDLEELIEQAHQRGIRLFGDLVMNHTSIEHSWFVESRSTTDNDKRDWYMWAAEPNLPCTPMDPGVFGESGWELDDTTGEYYFHQFYPQQPDLNYRNPEVKAAMLDVVRFWLDKGLDGYRVDAIMTLVEDTPETDPNNFLCQNHPLTHAFLQDLRAVLEEYDNKASLAETWSLPEETAEYFGDGTNEFHMSFSLNLSVGMQGACMYDSPNLVTDQLAIAQEPLPEGAQLGLWLSSHDQPRVMGTVGDDFRRAAAAAVMLLTLPGTPVMYYGDEVGLTNGSDIVVDKRDQSRTPMPWQAGDGVGFTSGTPWLAAAPGAESANVATQQDDPDSLLALHRTLIAERNRLGIFGAGSFDQLSFDGEDKRVMAYARELDGKSAVVLINFSEEEQPVKLNLNSRVSGEAKVLVAQETPPVLRADSAASYSVTLPPYGYVVWEL